MVKLTGEVASALERKRRGGTVAVAPQGALKGPELAVYGAVPVLDRKSFLCYISWITTAA